MSFCVVSYFLGGGGFARSRFRKNVGKSKGVFFFVSLDRGLGKGERVFCGQ